MAGFLYIFDYSDMPESMVPDGTSFQIVLPPDGAPVKELNYEPLTVWMADYAGGEQVLLSRLEIESIEELSSGTLAEHLILSGSPTRSVHFRRPGSATDGYVIQQNGVEFLPTNLKGSLALNDEQIDWLRTIEKNAWKTSFSRPDNSKITRALNKWNEESPGRRMTDVEAVRLIKSLYCESELYRYRSDSENLSPAGSHAIALLNAVGGTKEGVGKSIEELVNGSDADEFGQRQIDTDLRPVLESDFFTRKYLWPMRGVPSFDWTESLTKTERAERRHQEILADCCSYVASKGLRPMMNRNVDLAFDERASLSLFEIKSATAENFRAQALKGAIQVLEYALRFQSSGEKVGRWCLVIEAPPDFKEFVYYRDLLHAMGIEVVLYDVSVDWPMRADRLLAQS